MVGGGDTRWKKINELMTRATADTSKAHYKRDLGPTGRNNWTNRGRLLRSLSSLEFLRNLRIAEILFVEIKQVQAQAVLHLALAQIVQVRLPVAVLGQIFRHMRRQKNMPGIAAIQHPLGNVDSQLRQSLFCRSHP